MDMQGRWANVVRLRIQMQAYLLNPEAAQRLWVAFGVSLFLHLVLLSVSFVFPDSKKARRADTMEVTLVNSKSKKKPKRAQVLAQHNLDGGGNTAKDVRAQALLPNQLRKQSGEPISKKKRASKETEKIEKQRQLLLSREKKEQKLTQFKKKKKPEKTKKRRASDDLDAARAMAKLEAEISQKTVLYNKMPRKKFLSPRALSYEAALYLTKWSHKVERVGNYNYPVGAQGKVYGKVTVFIELRRDGRLYKSGVSKSSGHAVLDQAAIAIIKKAAPFGSVPPTVLGHNDLLGFARTISFTKGNTPVVE